MSSYNRRMLDSKFGEWLEEDVYISKGIQYAPRKYVVIQFIDELMDFVKSKGYVFRVPLKEIAQDWARMLFRCQNNLMKNKHIRANPDHSSEDYDFYSHAFDIQETEAFREKWLNTDDYVMNHACRSLMFWAFDFAWYYVNIRASKATEVVDQIFEASESDEEGKKTRATRTHRVNDPYLEDQANAASKYNRWD